MSTESLIADEPATSEDRQEYRAYLQRGETRLSTVHRVAGSFLSGAGLLTLLPVLLTNAFSSLFGLVVFLDAPGFPEPGSAQRWIAIAPVLVSLGLPLAALYSLIKDLIEFYFTPHDFGTNRERKETFPRFILSGIRVSEGTLSSSSKEALETARGESAVRNLIVPLTDDGRRRLQKEALSVGQLRGLDLHGEEDVAQAQLQDWIYTSTASQVRTLEQESAKMEASIARHHILLRALVLRYAKAFLLAILTLVMTVTALAVLGLWDDPTNGSSNLANRPEDLIWSLFLCIYAAWGLGAAWLVRRPIVWLARDVANTQSRRTPQSLAQFEQRTLVAVSASSIVVFLLFVLYGFEDVRPGRVLATALGVILTVCTPIYAYRAHRQSRSPVRIVKA